MKPARALTLKKETLTELVTDDLTQVVGASGPSCNQNLCPTVCTSCASDFQPCYSNGCVTTVLNCQATAETAC